MDASFLFAQVLTGLATASQLFLIASGLTIIFGVTRIVNFAHGALYMLGAYVGVTAIAWLQAMLGPAIGFWLGLVVAALAVGLLGVLMEVLLLRRIYRAPELFQLLATFGVALIVQDLVVPIWGAEELLGPRAPGLRGAVEIFGHFVPLYDLFLIALGPVVMGLMWLLFRRTRWGTLVRAATEDREMVGALGVRQATLFTGVVFLGACLAGLAGAVQLPTGSAIPFMDLDIIAEAFVVTVIGGMGSIAGAFIAALLIGQLQAFGVLVFSEITLVLIFLFMAVVLVVRPAGLLGRAETRPEVAPGAPAPPVVPLDRLGRSLLLAGILVLLAAPAFVGDYGLVLLTEAMVAALMAFSLHFMMGIGGMVSFGHAAVFGLGAYGAGLLVRHLDAPMLAGLAAAPLLAALGAALAGLFVVRLTGVYLAMLTLAVAQVFWSVAFQWVPVTGGDNGLIGIAPAPWASSDTAFHYLALLCCGLGVAVLWRAIHAPFGFALRAGRDSPRRAEAIGIELRLQRWLAIVASGAAAGLAGGVFAYAKGSIDPGVLSIPTSVDALVMVLLGGLHTVTGPLVGGPALALIEAFVIPLTDHWRLLLGGTVIALVLLFPEGLVGTAAAWRRRRAEAAER